MQNLPVEAKKNERPSKCWVNQVSPYSVNPSREIVLPTVLEELSHCIPVDLGAGLKTLAVVQDEARVLR
jgi:hypothetical protein